MRSSKLLILGWLLLLTTGWAAAQNAWTHGLISDKSGVYAGTINDSGASFGQYCYFNDESCYWILGNSLECVAGETYAALVSSPASSSHIELVCAGQNDGAWRYFVKPFDVMEQIVKKSDFLGVAIGTAAGQFRVNRFSLSGSGSAMTRAADIFHKTPKKPSTRDRTL